MANDGDFGGGDIDASIRLVRRMMASKLNELEEIDSEVRRQEAIHAANEDEIKKLKDELEAKHAKIVAANDQVKEKQAKVRAEKENYKVLTASVKSVNDNLGMMAVEAAKMRNNLEKSKKDQKERFDGWMAKFHQAHERGFMTPLGHEWFKETLLKRDLEKEIREKEDQLNKTTEQVKEMKDLEEKFKRDCPILLDHRKLCVAIAESYRQIKHDQAATAEVDRKIQQEKIRIERIRKHKASLADLTRASSRPSITLPTSRPPSAMSYSPGPQIISRVSSGYQPQNTSGYLQPISYPDNQCRSGVYPSRVPFPSYLQRDNEHKGSSIQVVTTSRESPAPELTPTQRYYEAAKEQVQQMKQDDERRTMPGMGRGSVSEIRSAYNSAQPRYQPPPPPRQEEAVFKQPEPPRRQVQRESNPSHQAFNQHEQNQQTTSHVDQPQQPQRSVSDYFNQPPAPQHARPLNPNAAIFDTPMNKFPGFPIPNSRPNPMPQFQQPESILPPPQQDRSRGHAPGYPPVVSSAMFSANFQNPNIYDTPLAKSTPIQQQPFQNISNRPLINPFPQMNSMPRTRLTLHRAPDAGQQQFGQQQQITDWRNNQYQAFQGFRQPAPQVGPGTMTRYHQGASESVAGGSVIGGHTMNPLQQQAPQQQRQSFNAQPTFSWMSGINQTPRFSVFGDLVRGQQQHQNRTDTITGGVDSTQSSDSFAFDSDGKQGDDGHGKPAFNLFDLPEEETPEEQESDNSQTFVL